MWCAFKSILGRVWVCVCAWEGSDHSGFENVENLQHKFCVLFVIVFVYNICREYFLMK